MQIDNLTISYVETPNAQIEHLALLDDAAPPRGAMLVGAVDGVPCAAMPVAGGRAIADPFRRTAEVVALLQLRVTQLQKTHTRRAVHRRP